MLDIMEAQFVVILQQIQDEFQAAAAERQALTQRLQSLAAQVDSLARAQAGSPSTVKMEELDDPIERYATSVAAQQAALDEELDRVASRADTEPHPPPAPT
jgi:hypothetical protein